MGFRFAKFYSTWKSSTAVVCPQSAYARQRDRKFLVNLRPPETAACVYPNYLLLATLVWIPVSYALAESLSLHEITRARSFMLFTFGRNEACPACAVHISMVSMSARAVTIKPPGQMQLFLVKHNYFGWENTYLVRKQRVSGQK